MSEASHSPPDRPRESPEPERPDADERFDPRERELCPDGACIGLIGPDGRCKECGTPGPMPALDPRTRGLRDPEEVERELETRIIEGDVDAAPDDFEGRRLCPDGACIGLIGPDGRCRECGAAAADSP